MNIGLKIRELRQKAGLTQKELADKMGFRSASVVTMWESGDRKLKSDMLPELSAVLGCQIGDLFELSGGGQDAAASPAAGRDA